MNAKWATITRLLGLSSSSKMRGIRRGKCLSYEGFCQCVHKKKKSLNSQTSGWAGTLHTQRRTDTHIHTLSFEHCINKKLSALCCDNLTFIAISTSQIGSVQKQMRILCPSVATATLSFRNYWLINLPQCALICQTASENRGSLCIHCERWEGPTSVFNSYFGLIFF